MIVTAGKRGVRNHVCLSLLASRCNDCGSTLNCSPKSEFDMHTPEYMLLLLSRRIDSRRGATSSQSQRVP